jgi:hypothetical protein
MSAQPQWEPVDNETADLLSLVATGPMSGHADHEWDEYVRCLHAAADFLGVVNPNRLRELTRGVIAPQRCGAYAHRAVARGLMVPHDWVTSDDKHGGNAGRPARSYRLVER